jgi:hypothetical protein
MSKVITNVVETEPKVTEPKNSVMSMKPSTMSAAEGGSEVQALALDDCRTINKRKCHVCQHEFDEEQLTAIPMPEPISIPDYFRVWHWYCGGCYSVNLRYTT